MEKKYEKPQIFFENIQMCTGVAACDYVLVGSTGNGFIESDQYDSYKNFGIAYASDSSCTMDPPICYHHPNDVEAFRIQNLS